MRRRVDVDERGKTALPTMKRESERLFRLAIDEGREEREREGRSLLKLSVISVFPLQEKEEERDLSLARLLLFPP